MWRYLRKKEELLWTGRSRITEKKIKKGSEKQENYKMNLFLNLFWAIIVDNCCSLLIEFFTFDRRRRNGGRRWRVCEREWKERKGQLICVGPCNWTWKSEIMSQFWVTLFSLSLRYTKEVNQNLLNFSISIHQNYSCHYDFKLKRVN